ncbi:MAG: hypothetical protein ACI9OJ_003802 [Myxococcota bacterium]|jgi:hypothetical protein
MPGMSLIIACALLTAGAPYEAQFAGPTIYTSLGGGHIDAFRVDPQNQHRVVAMFGPRAFLRERAGEWVEQIPADAFRRWLTAPSAGVYRLPNGEVLSRTAAIGAGKARIVGAAESGIYESADGFRTPGEPVLLPITAPLSVAFDPSGSGDVIVAGDPTGLFICKAKKLCQRHAPGRFKVVSWFADGTRMASDAKGGLWRFDGEAWERRQLSEAFVDITGVEDGGPRYGKGASGKWWLSEDHGLTWTPADAPAGRLGSGGLLARRAADGSLEVVDLNEKVHSHLEPDSIPAGAPIRWASQDVVVIGLADGVIAFERTARVARRISMPDGQKRPLLAARVLDDKLIVLAGRHQVEAFSTSSEASWSAERLADAAKSSLGWVLGLLAVGGLLVFWINRRLRQLAESP